MTQQDEVWLSVYINRQKTRDYFMLDMRQMLVEIRCILAAFAGISNKEIELPSDSVTHRTEVDLIDAVRRKGFADEEILIMTDAEREFWGKGNFSRAIIATPEIRMERRLSNGWGVRAVNQ